MEKLTKSFAFIFLSIFVVAVITTNLPNLVNKYDTHYKTIQFYVDDIGTRFQARIKLEKTKTTKHLGNDA